LTTVLLRDGAHHFLRVRFVVPLAADRGADIVHHHARALVRHRERDRAADAAARAGHHRDLVL
jgi:hypothetical protein